MVRFKYRYFTVQMSLQVKKLSLFEPFYIKQESITTALRNKIKELHGDYGVAAVEFGLQVKYCNPHTQIILVRAQHGAHRYVASALPFVKLIEDHPVTLKTLYTGTSLRHCFLFLMRYQKFHLKKIWHLLQEEQKKLMESAFLNVKLDKLTEKMK
ncbi:hypothetical protein R5R35_005843 [Gryllus longicercus]|uniref:Ribonuclease P/MRP protein subunit POP5 n=1 Tax=Gryllus longicercus TaxID=2509291 RepID=A0AAN9VS67_9ORTH